MIRVGEIVTWPKVMGQARYSATADMWSPQLHMIQNRAKIEKQIFIGRQAVRRSMQSKNMREPLPPTSGKPSPALRVPSISATPPPSGSDIPLSVDTDAEAEFARGSRRFFKRSHTSYSGTSTPLLGPAPSRVSHNLPVIRRKWASDMLISDAPTSDARRSPSPARHTASKTLFARLRSRSSQESNTVKEAGTDVNAEDAWSSDTSSDDELSVDDRRHIYHPSVLNFAELLGTEEEGK